MNSARPLILAAVLLTVSLAMPAVAWAQDADVRMRDQLRQTALALRQAQQENDELRAQLARKPAAAPPVASTSPAPRCDGDSAALAEARRQLKRSAEQATTAGSTLEEKQAAIEQWKKSYEQAVTLLRSRDAEAKRYQGLYEAQQGAMRSLRNDNAALVTIADELLQRYRDKGSWEALSHREPLTGLSRVELETLSQRYHARIVDATDPAATPSTPSAVESTRSATTP